MTQSNKTGKVSGKENFQLLWILYSDANSRFNTLIEECAHLQDTIFSLTTTPELIDEIVAATRTHDEVEGFTRPVNCLPKDHPKYYSVHVRDRALLSLWTLLGGLVIALDKNQRRHREAFEAAVEKLWRSDTPGGDHLFWYIATRGYFLTSGFKHYTSQLEHAHEKLIQMMENQPGTLPNPILMRRWNSGMYGEFLSEYSRHVNWEAQRLTSLISPTLTAGEAKLSVTHTWTHQPTSMATYFDVNLTSSESSDRPDRKHRYATIRSAYFYMEQPVLLPLLYHECAHISFPDEPDTDHKDFFGARTAAVHSLRLMKFPDRPEQHQYENFWEIFTEEVWADALSIALGGRGYLAALALQLLGLSGSNHFDHYEPLADMLVPPDEFGDFSKRKYPFPFPVLEHDFFWEARLLIACRLLVRRAVVRDEGDGSPRRSTSRQLDDKALAASIEMLIESYFASGDRAFSSEGTSRKHAELWKYRRELNQWVVDTTLLYLEEPFAKAAARSPVCSTYDLTVGPVRQAIESVVNCYRRKYLHVRPGDAGDLQFSDAQRLEDLSVDIRWTLAGDICNALDNEPRHLSLWTRNFANWMRHDGGAPFRIALEASRLKLSLYDAVADGLEEDLPRERGPDSVASARPTIKNSTIWQRLTRPRGGDAWVHFHEDLQSITDLFRRRKVTNIPSHQAQEYAYVKEVDFIVADAMEQLADYLMPNANDQLAAPEASVGTLTLGVIRPDTFARCGLNDSPYMAGMTQAQELFRHSFERHKDLADAKGQSVYLSGGADLSFAFSGLLGEYQFLSYLKGSTPVERDFHPSHQCAGSSETYVGSRHLLKPRMVLQVAGEDLASALGTHSADRWGRVALIRFKYRWQWLELMQRLQKAQELGIAAYSLLLSSAWEDVVLFTWHDDPTSLWRHRELGLKPGVEFGVDIQSAYSVPASRTSDAKPAPIDHQGAEDDLFLQWAKSTECVRKVYTRSGRFDYTVVWSWTDDVGHTSLENCARGLAAMPAEVWQQISSFITSYEQRSWSRPNKVVSKRPDPDGAPEDADPDGGAGTSIDKVCKTVTHFAIKNRLSLRPGS